ncbi:glycosyltransferase [Neomoorella humiferrea]|uniref:glycosyltransferase n=1 Tax=Neomoorella humiferrea TaxID=676965 RepID=UPI0030CC586C
MDRSHINFVNSYYGNQRTCFFFPHGGCKAKNVIDGRSVQQDGIRGIDILFGGSYQDPDSIRNIWVNLNTTIAKLLDEIVDYILGKDYINLAIAAENVDKYVRTYRRRQCLQVLSDSSLEVHVYGANWENARINAKNNILIHQPVGFLEMLGFIEQAKMVLNIDPNFADGGHERVFSAMINGAATLSNTNSFYSGEFTDGEDIILYSWSKLHELPTKIYGLLENPDKMEALRLAGKRKAEERHTWVVRAKIILDVIETYKSLKNLRVS